MRRSSNGQIVELNKEEGRKLFDKLARKHLHVSGEEFIRRWDAGEFHDEEENPDVMDMVLLLPFGR